MKEQNFWQTVLACLKALLIKCISFKNIGFVVGVWLGAVMGVRLRASFMEWAVYMLILIALFFTANEFQKWLIGMLLQKRLDSGSEPGITGVNPGEPEAEIIGNS